MEQKFPGIFFENLGVYLTRLFSLEFIQIRNFLLSASLFFWLRPPRVDISPRDDETL